VYLRQGGGVEGSCPICREPYPEGIKPVNWALCEEIAVSRYPFGTTNWHWSYHLHLHLASPLVSPCFPEGAGKKVSFCNHRSPREDASTEGGEQIEPLMGVRRIIDITPAQHLAMQRCFPTWKPCSLSKEVVVREVGELADLLFGETGASDLSKFTSHNLWCFGGTSLSTPRKAQKSYYRYRPNFDV